MFDPAELTPILPKLWRFGLVLSSDHDTANDLVQATCVRALEKKHLFQPGTRLDRWTFSILINIWRNELRSKRLRLHQELTDDAPELAFDGEAAIETNILASQLLTEVMKLPDAQKEAVLLVYIEGMKYREASTMLDVPIGTIMSRLSAARSKLAKIQDPRSGQPAPAIGGKRDG